MQLVAGESLQQKLDRERAACSYARSSGSACKSPRAWPRHMRRGSFIATSSRPTFCSKMASSGSRSPTLAWPRAVDDASLTDSGTLAGTPNFMSPEQARGEPVDQTTDLFSLGSVLYAMCTGQPPFRSESTVAVLRKVSDEPPRPIRELNPDVPEWLVAIISKLMAKAPAERYQSAAEAGGCSRRASRRAEAASSTPVPARQPLRPFARPKSRRTIGVMASMLGLAAAAIAIV